MNPDFDRIFSQETKIEPSPEFVHRVMASVFREASAPPPIPFPWMRALPGIACGIFAFLAMIILTFKSAPHASGARLELFRELGRVLEIAGAYGLGWAALAILITLACLSFSMRVATGSWRAL